MALKIVSPFPRDVAIFTVVPMPTRCSTIRMGIGRIVVEDAADPVSVIIFIAGQIPFLCIAPVNFFSALSCRKCTAGVKAVYKQSCRRWNIFHVSGRQGKDLQKQDQCRVQPAGDQPEVLPEVFLCACIIDIHVTVRTDDGNRLAVHPYSCKPEDQPAGGTDQTGNPKPLDFGSSNRHLQY